MSCRVVSFRCILQLGTTALMTAVVNLDLGKTDEIKVVQALLGFEGIDVNLTDEVGMFEMTESLTGTAHMA